MLKLLNEEKRDEIVKTVSDTIALKKEYESKQRHLTALIYNDLIPAFWDRENETNELTKKYKYNVCKEIVKKSSCGIIPQAVAGEVVRTMKILFATEIIQENFSDIEQESECYKYICDLICSALLFDPYRHQCNFDYCTNYVNEIENNTDL